METRLYRSRRDRMIGGVCGGLAEYFGVDVTLVRLAIAALALITSGAGVLAYVILWVLVPEEPIEGSTTMSDTTPLPVPEPAPQPPEPPAEPAAAAAPTYSPPTYTPSAEPAAPPAAPAQPAPTPYPAPQAVTGRRGAREVRNGGIVGGVVLIVLGAIFLASEFVPGIDIGKLWPLILVAIGVGIILRRR